MVSYCSHCGALECDFIRQNFKGKGYMHKDVVELVKALEWVSEDGEDIAEYGYRVSSLCVYDMLEALKPFEGIE